MIKLFCDCCGKEITETNKPKGGNAGRLGKISQSGMCLEVITGRDITCTWNSGDYCKYCIIDAVKSLDDRPQPGA